SDGRGEKKPDDPEKKPDDPEEDRDGDQPREAQGTQDHQAGEGNVFERSRMGELIAADRASEPVVDEEEWDGGCAKHGAGCRPRPLARGRDGGPERAGREPFESSVPTGGGVDAFDE